MPADAKNLRKMVLSGIFAALMTLCAWISLPVLEIAFTLQTFGVLLALGVLGGRWGSASILIYLLLGAVGLPVFSGFRSGLGVLLGSGGGYLLGFLGTGLIYWLATALLGDTPGGRLAGMLLGLFACYGLGAGWLLLFWLPAGNGAGLWGALSVGVLPYLLPDLLKLALAWRLTARLKRRLKY